MRTGVLGTAAGAVIPGLDLETSDHQRDIARGPEIGLGDDASRATFPA